MFVKNAYLGLTCSKAVDRKVRHFAFITSLSDLSKSVYVFRTNRLKIKSPNIGLYWLPREMVLRVLFCCSLFAVDPFIRRDRVFLNGNSNIHRSEIESINGIST